MMVAIAASSSNNAPRATNLNLRALARWTRASSSASCLLRCSRMFSCRLRHSKDCQREQVVVDLKSRRPIRSGTLWNLSDDPCVRRGQLREHREDLGFAVAGVCREVRYGMYDLGTGRCDEVMKDAGRGFPCVFRKVSKCSVEVCSDDLRGTPELFQRSQPHRP